jgi:hypothetical protein
MDETIKLAMFANTSILLGVAEKFLETRPKKRDGGLANSDAHRS